MMDTLATKNTEDERHKLLNKQYNNQLHLEDNIVE